MRQFQDDAILVACLKSTQKLSIVCASKFVVSILLIRHTIRSFSEFFEKKVNFDREDEDQKFETREREKMEKYLLSGIELFFNSQ